MAELSYLGVKIPTKDFDAKLLIKIKNKYTITVKNKITNTFIKTKMYLLTREHIYIPRFGLKFLLDKNIVSNVTNLLSQGEDVKLEYIGKSNYNQTLIIDHILNTSYKNKDIFNGLTLKLIAGGGKTYLGMDLLSRLNKKTLIIVPNTYLLEQWTELLRQYFPNNTIGEYYGKSHKDGDIVVAIINSMVQAEEFKFEEINKDNDSYLELKKKLILIKDHINPNQFIRIKNKINSQIVKPKMITLSIYDYFKQFGFVIFDESQSYISKEYRKIFRKINSQYILGLSATPLEREYNQDRIHFENIGEILDAETIEGYRKVDNHFESEVVILKYNGPPESTQVHINENTGMIEYHKIIEDLINDEYRNKLIINNILKLFNQGLNVFVFSDRRKHLEDLSYLLMIHMNEDDKQDIIMDDDDSVILYGGSSQDTVDSAKTRSKIIFTSYKYSSVGVSLVKMTALCLVTPKKSNMTQIINRIFRQNETFRDIKRIIIDFVDNKSCLRNQWYTRKQAYIERGCDISYETINYTDIEL